MPKAARKSPDASVTPATRVLHEAGAHFTVHRFEHDPRATDYGMEAARELGVRAEQVFKTLVLSSEQTADWRSLGVAVLPVEYQLDLRLAAQAFSVSRVQLAHPGLAAKVTGYVVGGISPLGQRRLLPTVLDSCARSHASILVSAGRRGMDVEVAPEDLLRILGARSAPLIREPATGLPTGY